MNHCFSARTIIIIYFMCVCLSLAKHTVFSHDYVTSGGKANKFSYTKLRIKPRLIKRDQPLLSQERNNITTSLNVVVDSVSGRNGSENTTQFQPSLVGNTYAGGRPKWLMNDGALERTGFVVLGIMSVLLFFLVIRAIRVRQTRSKSRKYGVITSTVSDMEMEPLERGDDDEEDMTLFDAQHKYRIK